MQLIYFQSIEIKKNTVTVKNSKIVSIVNLRSLIDSCFFNITNTCYKQGSQLHLLNQNLLCSDCETLSILLSSSKYKRFVKKLNNQYCIQNTLFNSLIYTINKGFYEVNYFISNSYTDCISL